MDDLPSQKATKLKCGHRMCNPCLKRSFKLSITDPQHMPPKCCTTDLIPLKHVDRLFDVKFKKTWNKKFIEYSSRDRIYCPRRSCGEFIRPDDIHHKHGKKYGQCAKCGTKACVQCSGKWHRDRDCPMDEETARLLAQAKEEGWQRCIECKALVELKEGCNHITWYVTLESRPVTCFAKRQHSQPLRGPVLLHMRCRVEDLRMPLV